MLSPSLDSVLPAWVNNNGYDWTSTTGISRLEDLLQPQLPYTPAPHQLMSTAKILMGQNVMCVWATGEGKSSVFYLHSLIRECTMAVVISPTNALEDDMVKRLEKQRLKAIAVNREALNAASKLARNLWKEVREGGYQVVFLSPEMLQSSAFKETIKSSDVRERLAVFCVDECHLVDEWGADFRKAYAAIKDTIPWLPPWTVRVGLTATLEPGRQTTIVMNTLGLVNENTWFDRRDCERRNVDIILRPIQHAFTTGEFLDLQELIPPNIQKPSDVPKTLIYCETIELGHRVTAYLRGLLPISLQAHKNAVIRHAHSLNCAVCKAEILDALYEDGDSDSRTTAIVVATDVLGVGMDVQDCDRIICFPTPSSVSSLVQRAGRASRARDRHGTAYIYIKKSDIDAVVAYLRSPSTTVDSRIIKPSSAMNNDNGEESHSQDLSKAPVKISAKISARIKTDAFRKNTALWCVIAAFVQGVCIVRQLNVIQGNPAIDRDCGRCSSCNPRPPSNPHPRPLPAPPSVMTSAALTLPAGEKLPTYMLQPPASAIERLAIKLEAIALKIRLELPYPPDALLIGSKAFLDRRWIARITNSFVLITSKDILKERLDGWRHWSYYGDILWREIHQLHSEFCSELRERHVKGLESRRLSKRKDREKEEEVFTEEEVREYIVSNSLERIKRVKLRVALPALSSNIAVGKENSSRGHSAVLRGEQRDSDACGNTSSSLTRVYESVDRTPLSPRKPRNGISSK